MNDLNLKKDRLLFIGFNVRKVKEYTHENNDYTTYDITGVRLYSVMLDRVFDASIEYFITHIKSVRHFMCLTNARASKFKDVNKALVSLLATHTQIEYNVQLGLPLLSKDGYCTDEVVRMVLLEETSNKVINYRGFRGYYMPKKAVVFDIDYASNPPVIKKRVCSYRQIQDVRSFYKTIQ